MTDQHKRVFIPEHELLDPVTDTGSTEFESSASLNAHGIYDTMRFVLRLSPRNHALMDSIDFGHQSAQSIDPEALQAYSTYLHETVHWWQHIGSTSGLVFSLCYPAQCHSSLKQLRAVLSEFGPKKSLKTWADKTLIARGSSAQAELANANIAVNNALDVEYYKKFAYDPEYWSPILFNQQHFECVGHGYSIVYGQLLGMVSDTVDPDFKTIPDARAWDSEFEKLRTEQVMGFYHGSPIMRARVGLKAIYEGQARFIQLQFLTYAADTPPTTQQWRDWGYLTEPYGGAFEHFLELSESPWPEHINDPVVDLFLLVCDLAINPTRGFPLEIDSFEHFIQEVDVGMRFTNFAICVARQPHLKKAIRDHSREEYAAVATDLCDMCGYDHPFVALAEISKWRSTSSKIQALMGEHKTFEYSLENLPLRVLLSHFVAFSSDKLIYPHFFCWPARWMTGSRSDGKLTELWLRHLSLFSDRGDRPGVYPRHWPERDPTAVHSMFERFYSNVSLYDLTRQWILSDGPFKIDLEWLSQSYNQVDADKWAGDVMHAAYGVRLEEFEIA